MHIFENRELSFAGGALIYDAGRVAQASPALFDPCAPELSAQPVGQGGRQAAWFVQGAFGRAVLRHYRRGGAMARVNPDRYFWLGAGRTRSFAEFHILQAMRARGLSVPCPIAAVWWRSGLSYRAAILVERIEASRPLASVLHVHDVRLQAALAQAIAAMHDAGFWHADLNAYNILLDAQQHVWLIDFDKARQMQLSRRQRHDNLARLRRSLIKLAGSQGDLWWKGIKQAYLGIAEGKKPLQS